MTNYTFGLSMTYRCPGCYRKYRNNNNYILPRTLYFIGYIFNFVEKFWNKK